MPWPLIARWWPVLRANCESAGADPYLGAAVVMAESSFLPHARGDNGDSIGLFQINVTGGSGTGAPPWFLDIPEVNLAYGCRLLASYAFVFPDDIKSQISAHNQGIGATKAHGWQRVSGYVEAVLDYYELFQDSL